MTSNTNRTHNKLPERLYFYCDAETAVRVLKDAMLPMRNTESFNGLTELSASSELQFDRSQLTRSAVKIACSLIFAPDEPKGESPLISAIRRWREAGRFANPEEAMGVLTELSAKLVDHRYNEIEKSLCAWREACSKLSVVSLYEKNDQFVLWDRYGNQHRGVAFALNMEHESDSEAPKAVVYSDAVPEITNLKEQVGALVYGLSVKPEKHIKEKFLTRPAAYKTEHEWRILNESNSEIYALKPRCLKATYFGPGIPNTLKTDILSTLTKLEHKPICYQSLFTKGRYELHHEQIDLDDS